MDTTTQPYAISIAQACQRLGVSRWTINRLINTHTLYAMRVGRRILIPVDSLNEWLHGNVPHRS